MTVRDKCIPPPVNSSLNKSKLNFDFFYIIYVYTCVIWPATTKYTSASVTMNTKYDMFWGTHYFNSSSTKMQVPCKKLQLFFT